MQDDAELVKISRHSRPEGFPDGNYFDPTARSDAMSESTSPRHKFSEPGTSSATWRWLPVCAALSLSLASAPALAQQSAPDEEGVTTSDAATPTQGENEASDNTRSGYDGGFWVESADGDHRLKLSGGFTPRLSFLDVAEPSEQGDELRFSIRRARVKLSGHAFTPRLEWELQAGLGGGNVRLLSANTTYEILEDGLYLYAGQDRLPYMREQLTSHWRLQFAERSIVEDQFGEGYDVGVALHNFKRDGFEWTFGVYNGTVSSLGTNPPADAGDRIFEPAISGRVGWSSEDLNGYTEGDLDGGGLRWGAGVSALSQLGLADGAERADKVALDFVLKAHGFSLLVEGHTAARSAGDGFFDQELFVSGARAQAGYVIADRVEPALRYAVVIPSADDTMTQEARAGLNLYLVGHRLKLQADAGALLRTTPGVERTDWSGRLQGVIRF